MMRSMSGGQGRRRTAAVGLAVGLAVLLAGMTPAAQAAEALKVQSGARGGRTYDGGGVRGYGSVPDPRPSVESRHSRGDDGGRRDHGGRGDHGWDRYRHQGYGYGQGYRPYGRGYYYPGGYYAPYYPGGYYAPYYPGGYYAPYYPGQWVWNGWGWVWVPGY